MKKIPAPVTATKRKVVTHYLFVVDESGSIGSSGLTRALTKQLHAQARGIIEAVKAENAKGQVDQSVTATLVTFGSPSTMSYTKFVRQPMERILDYTTSSHGGTPLFDAVADAINSMQSYERGLKADEDESFVLNVVTDGEEAHSQRYSAQSLAQLFQEKIGTDRWTFAWQLPRNSVSNFARRFGFPEQSCLGWDQTEQGVERATQATVNATSAYMTSRSAGVRSTKTYFAPDAANLAKAEVKAQLTEIPAANIKAIEVEKETDISTLISDAGLPFVAGAGYYLLTKKEKIHAHKSLILVPRGEKKYFVGKEDARGMLGLPTTGEVYVEPGNHGDWLIYVQSTSNNRKLVRGTKLLYRLDAKAGAVPQTWDRQKAHQEAQEKQLKVAMDVTQPLDNRVFGAIFAGKVKAADIQAVVTGAGSRDIDNALKRLKGQGLVEYTVLPNDTKKGWKPVKGAKAPKVQATP